MDASKYDLPNMKALLEALNKQQPSSPAWFQVIDHVVTTLLVAEIARLERKP